MEVIGAACWCCVRAARLFGSGSGRAQAEASILVLFAQTAWLGRRHLSLDPSKLIAQRRSLTSVPG